MSRSSFYNSPAQRGDEGMLRHHPFVFGGLGRFQRIHTLQLPSNATLAESPIDIFSMGLSAKVAVCGCKLQLSAKLSLQLHRGRAPPVMPPSITSSALVT